MPPRAPPARSLSVLPPHVAVQVPSQPGGGSQAGASTSRHCGAVLEGGGDAPPSPKLEGRLLQKPPLLRWAFSGSTLLHQPPFRRPGDLWGSRQPPLWTLLHLGQPPCRRLHTHSPHTTEQEQSRIKQTSKHMKKTIKDETRENLNQCAR